MDEELPQEGAAAGGPEGAHAEPQEGGVPAEAGAVSEGMPATAEAFGEALPEAGGGAVATAVAPTFDELSDSMEGSNAAALSLLYDLDLPVAIELGRTRLSVQEVLGLGRGSVIQLERQAGEPVDVFVGDRRFAEAEVVIVGEQFGVRITRIVSTAPISGAGTS